MKTTNLIITIVLFLVINILPQNIDAKLGQNGVFSIKSDNNTPIFQVTGAEASMNFIGSISLPNTSNYATGVIYKDAYRFLHDKGINNVFLGKNSGTFLLDINSSGNTGVGANTLQELTTGLENSAFGFSSSKSNQTGNKNSSFGTYALQNNLSDYNSAFGFNALFTNTTGYSNSAFGWNALRFSNGIGNTAIGTESLFNKTTGDGNTSLGYFAGYNITSGNNNTAIGYNALVPDSAGSNQIRLGNVFINYAGIQVAWTVTSDRRWKENIKPSNLGLGFITKLNPVSYTRKNDENQRTEYGLIAQDLEDVLKSEKIENTGMLNITNEGYYELRYNDLLSPMIKAIQDLKNEKDSEIAQLKNENEKLRNDLASIKELQTRLAKIEQTILNSDVKFSSNITE